MELIYVNLFDSRYDNAVKPHPITWPEFQALLAQEHAVLDDKSKGALFNCIRYKELEQVSKAPDAVTKYRGGQLHVRRSLDNIATVDVLVLDFDGTISIEEAQQRFRQYEHCGYTSYSHLADGDSHRFRIAIRLAEPIPAHRSIDSNGIRHGLSEWYQLRAKLAAFAGPCDPTSLNANQIYYAPAAHPDNQVHAKSWYNQGEPFNWRDYLSADDGGSTTDPMRRRVKSLLKGAKEKLHPDDVLRTQSGPVRVRDVQTKVEGVWCPFHNDRNGTEFVRRVPETGRVFLYCRRCDRRFDMVDESELEEEAADPPALDLDTRAKLIRENKRISEKEKKSRLREVQRQTAFDLFEGVGRGEDPKDKARIRQQLAKIRRAITKQEFWKDPKTDKIIVQRPRAHVVYMPEGAGKSMLALDLAKAGRTVVFACKSWEQAFEKHETFRNLGMSSGLTVQLFLSREAKLMRTLKGRAVHKRTNNPFDTGVIDEEASIQQFILNNPGKPPRLVRLMWHILKEDHLVDDVFRASAMSSYETINHEENDGHGSSDSDGSRPHSQVDILVTVFAQLRTLHQRKQFLPKDWIVWFDDPDVSDVFDIIPYDAGKHGELSEDQFKKKTRLINGRRYYSRNEIESLGWAYRNRLRVFTTTEQITVRAIQKLVTSHKQRIRIHDKMEDLAGGRITVLGTDKVYKRVDAVVPLLARRLGKEGHPVLLIADGLAQAHNHSNSKGKNTLTNSNLLVEISRPHPALSQTVCDALDVEWKDDGRDIDRELMLDRMHQAIGRNSGYRYRGSECVVLVDRKEHQWLVQNTRYFVDPKNSVLIDRTKEMSRRDRRVSDSASDMVSAIETFLNNLDAYFQDGRKVLPDIDAVMKAIIQTDKRTAYAQRLLHAIYSLSSCHPNNELGGPENAKDVAYRRAIQRIRTNCTESEWNRALAALLTDLAQEDTTPISKKPPPKRLKPSTH